MTTKRKGLKLSLLLLAIAAVLLVGIFLKRSNRQMSPDIPIPPVDSLIINQQDSILDNDTIRFTPTTKNTDSI